MLSVLKYVNLVMSFVDAVSVDKGLLLLHRPLDITNDCAFANHLRYDISFGMGMSDTITVVLRTLSEIDYECFIEIATVARNVHIIVVIRYPGAVGENCAANRDAFIVMKRKESLNLCDLFDDRDVLTPYYVFTVKERIRFKFISNSSINAHINAHLYQVTATSARATPKRGCYGRNETICTINDSNFCFTGGVVCDGIKNCGVSDWFDERKSMCGLPVERLGYAPVTAVIAAVIFTLLAAVHILLRCLPPLANSFFIFNANEDNRLCIDPVLKTPEQAACDIETAKRHSLIPVPSTSSSSDIESNSRNTTTRDNRSTSRMEMKPIPKRKTTMRSMTEKFQEKLRLVTGRSRDLNARLSSNDN